MKRFGATFANASPHDVGPAKRRTGRQKMNENAVVYVIDDDAAVRDSLAALLESHDLPVETFESGEAFFDAVKDGVDGRCLLLDLHLPVVGGLQILAQLAERGMRVPTIVITGGGDKKEMAAALAAGAIAVMEKPLDHRQLLSTLLSALA